MPPSVAAEWSRCRHWIIPALRDHTEDDVIRELATGRAQIWGTEAGAIVTQLVTADEPLLHIWLGGGRLNDLIALLPGLRAWGRAQGARAIWLHGRKGWNRALRREGFEPVGEELRRAL